MNKGVIWGLVLLLSCGQAFAADGSPKLQKCLKKAADMPDIAAADAFAWLKADPTNTEARWCRAIAQSNRGMHADAAREFWALASQYDKTDKSRSLIMHRLSGREFLAAHDTKNAEARLNAALQISPNDPESLIGRAQCRMEKELYWDALADLNRVLKTDSENVAALRQRGRVWSHLGNDSNSREDLAHAAYIDQGGKP